MDAWEVDDERATTTGDRSREQAAGIASARMRLSRQPRLSGRQADDTLILTSHHARGLVHTWIGPQSIR